MRYLSVRAMSAAVGSLSAVSVLLIGIGGLVFEGYGASFLSVPESLFPGFSNDGSALDLVIGSAYSLVAGGLAGCLLAVFYNRHIERQGTHIRSFWADPQGVPSFWAAGTDRPSFWALHKDGSKDA